MLKDLIKVANRLDSLGLVKEADFLDKLMIKISQGTNLVITSWRGEDKFYDYGQNFDTSFTFYLSGTINGKQFKDLKAETHSGYPYSFTSDDYCLIQVPKEKIEEWFRNSQFGEVEISNEDMFSALSPFSAEINKFIVDFKKREEEQRGEMNKRDLESRRSRSLTEEEMLSLFRAHFSDQITFKIPDTTIRSFVNEGSISASDLPEDWDEVLEEVKRIAR